MTPFSPALIRHGRLVAALAAMSVAACVQQPLPPPAPPPTQSPLEKTLSEAARESADALRALAEVEMAKTPPAKIDDQSVPDELKKQVSLKWVGPIGPAAQLVAREIGYEFSQAGKQPLATVVIDIRAVNQPVYQILQDIGLQAGKRADVSVNVASRRIEVRYAAE